jgi:hypothetical protein
MFIGHGMSDEYLPKCALLTKSSSVMAFELPHPILLCCYVSKNETGFCGDGGVG